jgi:hypothetical protein
MGERLYPNVKRITSLFCFAIIMLTVGLFALRLTALRDMVRDEVSAPPVPTHEEIMINGTAFGYVLFSEIDFASPDSYGSINVENIEGNSFRMRLEIIYDITDRSVYLSPFLRPGDRISSMQLQGLPLPPGEHRCTAIIIVYELDGRGELHRHSQPVTIKIGQ